MIELVFSLIGLSTGLCVGFLLGYTKNIKKGERESYERSRN